MSFALQSYFHHNYAHSWVLVFQFVFIERLISNQFNTFILKSTFKVPKRQHGRQLKMASYTNSISVELIGHQLRWQNKRLPHLEVIWMAFKIACCDTNTFSSHTHTHPHPAPWFEICQWHIRQVIQEGGADNIILRIFFKIFQDLGAYFTRKYDKIMK